MSEHSFNLKHNILKGTLFGTPENEILIQLHGIGSNKEDLFSFAQMLPRKYTIISVQAPLAYYGGWAWYNLYPSADGFISNIPEAKSALSQIQQFIHQVTKTILCKPKISLMGFSQGAILSLAAAFNAPQNINKVVAMSGYINQDLLENKSLSADIQILATHGLEDEVIAFEKAKSSYEPLREKTNFNFKSYQMGHNINNPCLQDVIDFLNS